MTRLDLIHTQLGLSHTRLDLIHTRLDLIHTRLDLIPTRIYLIHDTARSHPLSARTRVSFETSFDSKQPKLEPKLVSALSETERLFRLFRFYTETDSFDVSIEPKQKETNRNSLIGSIFCYFLQKM